MDPICIESDSMLWLLLCEQSTGERPSLIMTMKHKRVFPTMKIILRSINSVMILTMNQMRKLFIFLKATHSHKKIVKYKVTGSHRFQPMMACWPLSFFTTWWLYRHTTPMSLGWRAFMSRQYKRLKFLEETLVGLHIQQRQHVPNTPVHEVRLRVCVWTFWERERERTWLLCLEHGNK